MIEGCRIKGPMILAILWEAVRDVTFSNNLFTGGEVGLSLELRQSGRSSGITVRNNTFYNSTAWIGFGFSDLGREDVHIERNLIVGCSEVRPSAHGLEHVAKDWFRDNLGRTRRPMIWLGWSRPRSGDRVGLDRRGEPR